MFILLKAKIFLYFDTYRLQIAEDGSSELQQHCWCFSDLNEILLESIIDNIKTLTNFVMQLTLYKLQFL